VLLYYPLKSNLKSANKVICALKDDFCGIILLGDETMNFTWDYCAGTETIIRKMVLGNLEDFSELLNKYKEDKLKEIFSNTGFTAYSEDTHRLKICYFI